MARGFCSSSDCEVLYEGFADLATGTVATGIITQASDWLYAQITEFHAAPSSALPASGVSPNFWIKTATASESIYLAITRRHISNGEDSEGYWDVFHKDAVDIVQGIRDGNYRLDPQPTGGEKGIGIAEAVANGDVEASVSSYLQSNRAVPDCYYQDETYSRLYTIELEDINATLKTSTFKWKTDLTDSGEWEETGVLMDSEFVSLSHGVCVRFLPSAFENFLTEQRWQIQCYPERDQKNRAIGGSTFFMERG